MSQLIKSGGCDKVIFGTQDLKFQRFTFFIMLMLLVAGKFSSGIADEQGRFAEFSLIRFLLISTPKFIFELIVSAIVVVWFHIKYLVKLWLMKSK